MRHFVVYNRCERIQQIFRLSLKARAIVSRVSVLQNRVLLLNGSTWEPLSVITVQRAINLVLGGKAIAVEMTGQYLHTVRAKFEVPSVIALRSYVNVPRRKSHWSRKGVLVRDNYTCIYCGIMLGALVKGKVLSKRDFTIDHIIPRCQGGKDTWSNTACACAKCNHRKGNR
ncbi:MAG: HNH endonuclease, partial [Chloroflexi bacterium]|nr:HNH endonuclease [Chloroflexota bacterium]